MIDADKRGVILTLYRSGKGKKKIARLMNVDIKTVRHIIAMGDEAPHKIRKDNIEVDEVLLRGVYKDCSGYTPRTHEVLTEEHGLVIGYSTLTRKLREMGLGVKKTVRSFHVEDVPGEEMQHDTSPYKLKIGGVKMPIICSGLYLRYSKMRYIKFYRRFNRFTMKCFMEEALQFWGYSAAYCIIDNTNLAIHHGSGARAVMVPEMVKFAENYGFEWKAHEIKHSDRKAGVERSFWTLETNFFPGRTFTSPQDLNAQAFLWATERYAKRPQSKTGLIPIDTFENEKSFLTKLPEYISPVNQVHERSVDEYGYCAFQGNYYWVPDYKKEESDTES